jgi:hypothetical protein
MEALATSVFVCRDSSEASMRTVQLVVVIWFGVSVVVSVVENTVFYYWLRARGVRVRFIWAGWPPHLDGQYAEWCRARGRSPRRVLVLRKLSIVNMLLAAFFAIPLLSAGH